MITLTSRSWSARRSSSNKRARTPLLIALRFSGRFSVMRRTCACGSSVSTTRSAMTTKLRRFPRAAESRLQTAHAVEPPVVVGRLAAEVLEHFGVGEDQEVLRVESFHDYGRDLIRFEHPVDSRDPAVDDAGSHPSAHGLRREHPD